MTWELHYGDRLDEWAAALHAAQTLLGCDRSDTAAETLAGLVAEHHADTTIVESGDWRRAEQLLTRLHRAGYSMRHARTVGDLWRQAGLTPRPSQLARPVRTAHVAGDRL